MSVPATTVDTTPAVVKEKPLNAAQIKSLERLVESDFADLYQQVENQLAARFSRQEEALREKFKDESRIDKHAKAVEKLVTKFKNDMDALVEKINADGVTYQHAVVVTNIDQFKRAMHIDGLDDELRKLGAAYDRVVRTARGAIDRAHRKEERKILLQSIGSQSAADIVNNLPQPADILSEMEVELSAENADDLKTLGLMDA